MSEWKAKRFWEKATIDAQSGGFGVLLDTRPVRTPAKAPLIVPTKDMAQAIAAEWDAQTGQIDPGSMPVTKSANAAIDKVQTQAFDVARMIADYGDADLICYRAEAPSELVARQDAAWDPLIDWAASHLGAPLEKRIGVIHRPQSAQTLATLAREVTRLKAFELTALHDLVSLSGSLIIGLGVSHGHQSGAKLWDVSRIDEQYQIDRWGADDEAAELANRKRADFLHAERFLQLARAAL